MSFKVLKIYHYLQENSFGQADYDDELQNNEQQISFEADGEYPSET